MKNLVKKAVIPVAGMGSRFLPMTLSVSKEMFPIIDVPVLLLILKECADSGIKEVMLIIRKEKRDIKKFFTQPESVIKQYEDKGRGSELILYKDILKKLKITFRYQRQDLIGTGGAIYVAKKWCNGEPFAVLYGDDINYTEEGERPVIGQLIDTYNKYQKLVMGCKEVAKDEIAMYGSCKLDGELSPGVYKSHGVIEKPAPGTEPSLVASLARYILPGDAFRYLERKINCERDITKEVNLTDDCLEVVLREQGGFAQIMKSERFDTGSKLGYLKCIAYYGVHDKRFGKEFKDYLKTL